MTSGERSSSTCFQSFRPIHPSAPSRYRRGRRMRWNGDSRSWVSTLNGEVFRRSKGVRMVAIAEVRARVHRVGETDPQHINVSARHVTGLSGRSGGIVRNSYPQIRHSSVNLPYVYTTLTSTMVSLTHNAHPQRRRKIQAPVPPRCSSIGRASAQRPSDGGLADIDTLHRFRGCT